MPDLVIEIVSPGDRPSDRIALETDYTTIGVAEIVFIDQRRRHVRVLRRGESDYDDKVLKDGAIQFDSFGGLELELDWLFDEPRPDELDLAMTLLGE